MYLRIISLIFAIILIMPKTLEACPVHADFTAASFTSASAEPKAAKLFQSVNRTMPIQMIIEKLGPAARDVGSGLYVLEWDVIDGRVFRVSVAGPSDKPMAIGFAKKRGSSLR
jgi:hypothetical protein